MQPTNPAPGLLRIARQAYQDLLETGREFLLSEVAASVSDQINGMDPRCFRDQAIAGAVKQADQEQTRGAKKNKDAPGQIVLWAVDGAFPLGENRRISKRDALFHHGLEVMEIHRQNRDAVNAAFDRHQAEFERLASYWDRPGVTLREAIEAADSAEPDE